MDTTKSLVSGQQGIDHYVAYGLRMGVKCILRSNSKPMLILGFPLKAIAVNPCWRPLLQLLSSGKFVSFEKLASAVPCISSEKVRSFMEHLVRKAFCNRKGIDDLAEYPTVSIIIPVRNRMEELAECLHSLTRLNYPSEKLEIIVVDDASTDETPTVGKRFGVKMILLKNHKQASFCRNLGARHAGGEILAFIDSDCVADTL